MYKFQFQYELLILSLKDDQIKYENHLNIIKLFLEYLYKILQKSIFLLRYFHN